MNTFRFYLLVNEGFDELSTDDSSENLSNHEAELELFMDKLCDRISSTNLVFFKVGGFGEDNWKTDVRTDLPVILNQFPSFLLNLKERRNASLDFYEQGLQRMLNFSRHDHMLKIECLSYSMWTPNPTIIEIDADAGEKLFFDFIKKFIYVVKSKFPVFYRHKIFQSQFGSFSNDK